MSFTFSYKENKKVEKKETVRCRIHFSLTSWIRIEQGTIKTASKRFTFSCMDRGKKNSYLEVKPIVGKSHQIVHKKVIIFDCPSASSVHKHTLLNFKYARSLISKFRYVRVRINYRWIISQLDLYSPSFSTEIMWTELFDQNLNRTWKQGHFTIHLDSPKGINDRVDCQE